uniref:Proliferating cell nuclear antigen n=1 Tax=Pithovirus LCPAC001 TaxID=2506585 RepID=A0A481Z2B3_9VIRU|nr:MAG: proliferating cell nuclear antigen [Pithovirus LCPAC001]
MDIDIDANTEFLVRFKDFDSFKHLIAFMANIISGDDVYMVFTKNNILLSYRLVDIIDDKTFNLEIFCKLDQYFLTKHYYRSNQKMFIVGLDIKLFNKVIKSCKKNHPYFQIERRKDGVYTSKSKKDRKFISTVSIANYKHYEELKYKTSLLKPFCVVTAKDFCDSCLEFQGLSSPIIEIFICSRGFVIVCPNFSMDGNIITADIQKLGEVPKEYQSDVKIRCIVSKSNLVKLSKLEKTCPKGNVRIYVERDENGKLMPLKISHNIGIFGTINSYLEIEEVVEKH